MHDIRAGGLVSRRQVIYRSAVMASRDTLFVFGDNLARRGFGGQAAAMRGEPNAVGIPTKRLPTMHPEAFFTDADFDEVKPHVDAAIERLRRHLEAGGKVALPAEGIGTGLAELPKRAPLIHSYITVKLEALVVDFGEAQRRAQRVG